ncbi:DUF222 domain-containing protein, partial [Arthrobacter sp. Bi83]|uniref:DUF222 domain-containing protein n=1 Tax=Arthrobacter sp. Bi83 TaxID=2822353 RepID=UPI001E53D75A
MEAMGEHAADHTAGQAVTPGLSAASLLRGRALRSVPASALLTDHAASDGGAAAGGAVTSGSVTGVTSTGTAFSGGAAEALEQCLEALASAVDAADNELGLASFREAADFADLTEELSRRTEHLQLLAAAAVERTRTEAVNAAGPAAKATGWTTGWGTDTDTAGDVTGSGAMSAAAAPGTAPGPARVRSVPADDGCRNTAEYLRVRLRISIGEARRRLALAAAVLPRTGLNAHPMPPACEQTAANLAAGTIASRAGTIITTALDKARPITDPATLHTMEAALNRTALENDHDFLLRIAHRWTDAIDQDGTEPSEEELRHRQGAFTRRPRRGLHHLEIFATTDQYEHLLTAMNTATNPRTQPTTTTADG